MPASCNTHLRHFPVMNDGLLLIAGQWRYCNFNMMDVRHKIAGMACAPIRQNSMRFGLQGRLSMAAILRCSSIVSWQIISSAGRNICRRATPESAISLNQRPLTCTVRQHVCRRRRRRLATVLMKWWPLTYNPHRIKFVIDKWLAGGDVLKYIFILRDGRFASPQRPVISNYFARPRLIILLALSTSCRCSMINFDYASRSRLLAWRYFEPVAMHILPMYVNSSLSSRGRYHELM